MPRLRSSRSLRAGLAVVAASAAALGVPALASAKPVPSPGPTVPPTPSFTPTHTFETPVINGDFSEWTDADVLGPASIFSGDTPVAKAEVSMRYDCRAGRLNLRVEADRGVTLASDREAHGGALGVAESTDETTFTGASEQVRFAFARDGDNVTGWEMSIPLADGDRYVGIGFTTTADGIAEFSGALEISCPTLTVEKSADGSYDELYDWSLEKPAVDALDMEPDSGFANVRYTVTATRLGPEVINRRVSGYITATNPSTIPVPDVLLREKGTNIGALCRIVRAENNGAPVPVRTKAAQVAIGTLAPGTSATSFYECVYTPKKKAAQWGVNYGQVSWPGPGKYGRSATSSDNFRFSPANALRDNVTLLVGFENQTPLATELDASKTLNFTGRLPIPAIGCQSYVNTARLIDPDDDGWQQATAVSTEVCADGTTRVTPTTIADPTPNVPMKAASLRAAIKGPRHLKQGQRARYRVRIGNRGKHNARRVVSRITVPRGMKIARVLHAPRNAVVRGRTVRMRFNRINIRRAKNVVVVVKVRNGAPLGNARIVVRAQAANLKGQKPARATKRVRIARGL